MRGNDKRLCSYRICRTMRIRVRTGEHMRFAAIPGSQPTGYVTIPLHRNLH